MSKRERGREGKEKIYEEEKEEEARGWGVMQAQSVTEIERFHEQGRERKGNTGREAESASSAGRREGTRGRRKREVDREEREKMMEPRNRLHRTASHPRSVRQT